MLDLSESIHLQACKHRRSERREWKIRFKNSPTWDSLLVLNSLLSLIYLASFVTNDEKWCVFRRLNLSSYGGEDFPRSTVWWEMIVDRCWDFSDLNGISEVKQPANFEIWCFKWSNQASEIKNSEHLTRMFEILESNQKVFSPHYIYRFNLSRVQMSTKKKKKKSVFIHPFAISSHGSRSRRVSSLKLSSTTKYSTEHDYKTSRWTKKKTQRLTTTSNISLRWCELARALKKFLKPLHLLLLLILSQQRRRWVKTSTSHLRLFEFFIRLS